MINLLLIILVAFLSVQFVVSFSNQTEVYPWYASVRYQGALKNSSEYSRGLQNLLGNFSSQASNTGFYNPITSSSSQTQHAVELYGLYMCRGDIDQEGCRVCINNAKRTILTDEMYDNAREVLVWYEYCMLRYSDKPFFGKYDVGNNMMSSSWCCRNKTHDDSTHFEQIRNNAVNSLALHAAFDPSGKRFGTKVVKFTPVDSLYALMQCTPDLAAIDCYKCLKTANTQVHKMVGGKSGNIMRRNCVVRFETFPFFRSDKTDDSIQLSQKAFKPSGTIQLGVAAIQDPSEVVRIGAAK